MKHLLKLLDCSTEEIIGLLDLAELFYSDPANVKRFEEWQKKQEGKRNDKRKAV